MHIHLRPHSSMSTVYYKVVEHHYEHFSFHNNHLCESIYGPKQIRISLFPLTIHLFTTVQPAMNASSSITITCGSIYGPKQIRIPLFPLTIHLFTTVQPAI